MFSPQRTAVLALSLLALLVGGIWFYHAEKTSARMKAGQQLASVARFKVDQLNAWRTARLGDAVLLAENAALGKNVLAFFSDPAKAKTDELRNQLHSIRKHGRYAELLLVDREGRVRLSLNGQRDTLTGHAAALAEALRSERPVFTELHGEPHYPEPHIGLVVPLYGPDLRTRSPVGAVVLIDEAAQFLQPILHSWVKPSATMEVMLVRQEGDAVVLLNALPRQAEAAVHPGSSLEAMAVSGHEGVVEGNDFRGVESLAVLLPVPDSSWFLIAKDEAAEIFGVWRFRAALLMLLFAVLVLGLGSFGLFVWQYNQKAYYQALYGAEAQLRHSLEHHGITLKAIGDGIIATDGSGRVELLNPVAEMLTGWSQADAFGRPLEEVYCVVDERTRARVDSPVPEMIRAGATTNVCRQTLLIAKNGVERAITESASPMHNDQGVVIGVALAFRDQTEERRAERLIRTRLILREYAFPHTLDELLIRALQEIALLADSVAAFFQIADPERKVVTLARWPPPGTMAFRAVEYGEESEDHQAQAEDWPDSLTAGRPLVQNNIEGASAGEDMQGQRFGTVRELLVPVVRTGKVIAVLGVADKPENYTDKDVDLVAQIAEDFWRLVEQKRVEEALLASERRYRTLYQSMMDAFVVTDMAGNIRECNDAYGAMLGYTNEELKRLSVRDVTPATWQVYENEYIRKQLMHGGCSSLYEKEYRRKDGTVFPVELRTFLILNNDGQPEGLSAIVRDITERKQAEEEQERLRERLNLAQKMESVGQLAGGVAHDFNNMLSVILGYADLALRKMDKSDPLYKHLQQIAWAGRRSADITRQLLAFARKQTIAPRILDLNDTLEEMLKMLQRLIGEHIELNWLPGKDLWPVLMDPSQVDQLLANLCVNARDAMRHNGTGKITIETGKVTFDTAYCSERPGFIPGDFVLLAVSDNGCGIERDILDKIFEPFFTTKGVGEGTGLGLATVYGIVKQNQGFINVYSEPGEGTTFRIYLPRMEGQAGEDREEHVAEIPQGHGETVLVVEDDEAILFLNKTILENLGYTVLTASSPRQALQLAKRHAADIDLLLTDVIMPEMNGRDLAKAIRVFGPEINVLFVSGYTANVIAHRGVLDEGVCFLPKPFTTDDLAVKIRAVLGAA